MTYDVKELLSAINPSMLSYQEGLIVGMALKESGYTASETRRPFGSTGLRLRTWKL